MERVSYDEILKWLKQQPKLPIIVPTLGFNSSISVNLSNNNTTFIVTGSTGKKKEIDQTFWDAEMNTMVATLEERKCITTTYSSAGNGHPYLWAPGLIAICREYWRQKANFKCAFLKCIKKKRTKCIDTRNQQDGGVHVKLIVRQTHARRAFDIEEGTPIPDRSGINKVCVQYNDTIEEACLKTYKGSKTLRHKDNISINIIDKYHLQTNVTYDAILVILDNCHLYKIKESNTNIAQ